jgi:5-methylcytosine-specific restriction endonuclease McrA
MAIYKTNKTFVEVICPYCHNNFYTIPAEIKRGNGKYCSRSCATKSLPRHKPLKIPNDLKSLYSIDNLTTRQIAKRYNTCHRTVLNWLERLDVDRRTVLKIDPIKSIRRSSWQYKQFRLSILARDNHTCTNCGANEVKLHVDHIKQFAYYPELRLDMNNCRTLCIKCHRSTETWGKRIMV